MKQSKRIPIKGMAVVRGQTGASLIESVVAVAILGTVIVSLLVAFSTGSVAVNAVDEQVTVENLARSQLEYTKDSPYTPAPTTYPLSPTLTLPAGYEILAEALPVPDTDDNIQKIRVTVSRDGEAQLVVEDFKVNR